MFKRICSAIFLSSGICGMAAAETVEFEIYDVSTTSEVFFSEEAIAGVPLTFSFNYQPGYVFWRTPGWDTEIEARDVPEAVEEDWTVDCEGGGSAMRPIDSFRFSFGADFGGARRCRADYGEIQAKITEDRLDLSVLRDYDKISLPGLFGFVDYVEISMYGTEDFINGGDLPDVAGFGNVTRIDVSVSGGYFDEFASDVRESFTAKARWLDPNPGTDSGSTTGQNPIPMADAPIPAALPMLLTSLFGLVLWRRRMSKAA